jgi:hypothetical protein
MKFRQSAADVAGRVAAGRVAPGVSTEAPLLGGTDDIKKCKSSLVSK